MKNKSDIKLENLKDFVTIKEASQIMGEGMFNKLCQFKNSKIS